MPKRTLDHTDIQLLNILQRDGSISNLQLSKKLGLATSTTLMRVKKLKQLNLLPSAHYLLNKELLGYKELFLTKISLKNDQTKIQAIERHLLKDGLVESLWSVGMEKSLGAAVYKALVRSKNHTLFAEWCDRLIAAYECFIETEEIEIQLKERSDLKLTYHDLEVLRKLYEG